MIAIWACTVDDCNNRGTTDDSNYANGCGNSKISSWEIFRRNFLWECDCDNGFTGSNCEMEFSFAPSKTPSATPTVSTPSEMPSLAPSCYEYDPEQLGNPDLKISAEDSFFVENDFTIALRVPTIYQILSLGFADSDLAQYESSSPGPWVETAIPCIRIWSAEMDVTNKIFCPSSEKNNHKWMKKHTWRDSKPQSPPPEVDILSIRPQALLWYLGSIRLYIF